MRLSRYLDFIKENKSGKSAVIITAEGFQDEELLVPKERLQSNGVLVTIAGISLGEVKAYNSDKTVSIEKTVNDLSVFEFDILIIPGGKAPGELRNNPDIIRFVNEFSNSGKPIAAICHGPQVLISAGLVEGKNMTCFEDAKYELIEAGAIYQDKSCVIDGQFITSRNPKDIPDFSEAILSSI